MSKTILNQCLQLVEDDLPTNSTSSKTSKKKKQTKQKGGSIFDLIPEQKRLTITRKNKKNQTKGQFTLRYFEERFIFSKI